MKIKMETEIQHAFDVTYATAKQTEKRGYTGYPAFPRIVCVTNGSRTTQYTDFSGSTEYNQNSPFLFIPGHEIVDHTLQSNSYFVKQNQTKNMMFIKIRNT